MKRLLPDIITTIILCVIASTPAAAEENLRNFGISSGLSNGYVVAMTQDRNGFIWIATEDGLNRFDGNQFRIYSTQNSGITSNELNDIAYTSSYPDSLWIATQRDGVCVLDFKTGEISPISVMLKTPDVTSITPASDGRNIWFTHYHHGAELYDPVSNTTRLYNHRNIEGMPNRVWTMAEAGNDKIYLGHSSGGFSVVDTLARTFENYRHIDGIPSLPGDEVYSIAIDDSGSVWLGTDRGAALFNPHTKTVIPFVHDETDPYSIGAGRVRSVRRLKNGEIWFATSQGGVSVLNPDQYTYSDIRKARFRQLQSAPDDDGLSGMFTRCVFQDCFGNVWIGNYRAGIDMISHISPLFSLYDYADASPFGHRHKPAWSCDYDSCGKKLWFGGENEIICSDGKNVTTIPLPGVSEKERTYVRAIKADTKGRIWVGTSERGAMVYNPSSRSFSRLQLPSRDVRSFMESPDGKMWIGTARGIFASDGISATELEVLNSQLADMIIQAMATDSFGNVWVGTFGKGLAIFSPQGQLIKTLQMTDEFPSNAINAIKTDSKGAVWIATRNGAVKFPDPTKPDSWDTFDNVSRLGVTHVKAIEEDGGGNMWLSTNKGMLRLEAGTMRPSLFESTDRLPLNSFAENASVKNTDGHLFFASANGIFALDPTRITGDTPDLAVKISDITIYRDGLDTKDNEWSMAFSSDAITLLPDERTFRITFTMPDAALADHTEISYNLNGLDDVWNELQGGGGQAFYRNLPPGKYRFQVRQRLKGHDWSPATTLLTIDIRPHFWMSVWAIIIYLMLAVAAIVGAVWLYNRRERNRRRIEMELENNRNRDRLNEERLKFYTNVTHELRTPLTLILGPLEDMVSDPSLPKKYAGRLQAMRNSSNTLLNLINDILEFRKTETHNRRLSVSHGNIANFIREIGLRFKELNQNPDTQIILDIDENLPSLMFDREIISTVLNNLVSNALKYTPQGSITISCRLTEEMGVRKCRIAVADTGHGIAPDCIPHIFKRYFQADGRHQASGTGLGLALVKSQADLHQAEIKVESVENEGSVFTFTLLVDNSYPDALHIEPAPQSQVFTLPIYETDNKDITQNATRILVVEDNADIREYIRQTLEDEFTVFTASNGLEGLKAVQEKNPDVIISDIMMPEMDGITLCRTIKENIVTSHIPVILLTAKDSISDREEGYESGASSYLSKPFSAKLLLSRIRNILRTRRLVADHFMSQATTSLSSDNPVVTSENKQGEEASRSLSPLDRDFVDKLLSIVNENLEQQDLGVNLIAEKMCMSNSTLYRKTMAVLGVSTNEYIRRVRLSRAAELLLDGRLSVSDVAFKTGFGSLSSFAKAFRKEFGMTASEYVAAHSR